MTTIRRATGILTIVAGLAAAVLLPVVADAHDARPGGYSTGVSTSTPSVFPQPRDPWKSWGVRRDVPKHVGAPHWGHQNAVWVPAQWFWDGAAWVWWPGHWAAR